jgi:hypothetical protein
MKLIKFSGPVLLRLMLPAALIFSCNSNNNNKEKQVSVIDTLHNTESANPYIAYDQSPMDMSYYPQNYPVLKMNGTDSTGLIARLIYSRPQKKGRVIFGYNAKKSLREYGKEWRLGANEATEIEFFKDVIIGGKKINRGRYIMYCIPYPDKWTIVLNSNLYTWGLHMDRTKDIFKTDVPLVMQSPALEDFTMVFEPADNGTDLVMAWDSLKAILPVKFAGK